MAQKQSKVCPSCKQAFKSRPNAITCSNRCRKRLYRTRQLLTTEAVNLKEATVDVVQAIEHEFVPKTATQAGFIQVAEGQPPINAITSNPTFTAPTLPAPVSPVPVVTPTPQTTPTPITQYDWNRYEVPKSQPNKFVDSTETLDNAAAFKTIANQAISNLSSQSQALPQPLFKWRKIGLAKYAALSAVIVLTLAIGSSLLRPHSTSNTDANLVTNQKTATGANTIQSGLNQATLKINRNTVVASGKSFIANGPVIIQNAAGTNLLTADTVNNQVGIGTTPIPTGAVLQVAGDISANGVILGKGGKITLGPDGLRINNVLICSANGCVSSSSPLSRSSAATVDVANVAYINQNQTFSGVNILLNPANQIGGNGSGLTALDASNISTGTLDDNRLSANIARLNIDQTFSGVNILLNPANQIGGNGSGLTGLNASNIASGTVSDARLSGNVALLDANNVFSGDNTFNGITVQNGNFLFQSAVNSTGAFQIQNAAGNNNLLVADTINTRIGIGTQPNYTLDVNGDVNVSAGHTFRIDGADVCSGGLCNPSSGSGFYIQNNHLTQAAANFNVQSADSTYVVGVVKAANGQTADLLEAQDFGGTPVFAVDPSGNVNILGNYKVNGATICGAGGCTPASGSGAYIQNGTSLQTGANFNIEASATNTVAAILKGKSGQSVDIFQIKDGNANAVLTVGNQGQTLHKDSSAGSATFFQIQNSSSASLLTANTITGQILFPNATVSSSALLLGGDANLYRSSASNLKTDGSLEVAGTIFADSQVAITRAASGNNALEIRANGDSQKRLVVTANGDFSWGSGSAVGDTNLYRSAVNTLRTDSNLVATGIALFKNSADSTTAFQVQNAAGTSNLLVADTTDTHIGIGTATPLTTLNVNGTGLIQGTSSSPSNLTMSGNEITDATRATNAQGDGTASPDSSTGIWEGTTNLIPNGGFESNTTGWLVNGATLSRDTSQPKFGGVSGKLTWNARFQYAEYDTLNLSSSTPYAASFWIYQATGSTRSIKLELINNAQSVTIGTTVNVPSGIWTRVTAAGSTDASSWTAALLRISMNTVISSNENAWIDGVQVEQKHLATPYVETNGATASRSQAQPTHTSTLLNSTQGWIVYRYRPSFSSSQTLSTNPQELWQWNGSGTGDNNNNITLYYSYPSRQFALQRIVGGITYTVLSAAQTFNAGDLFTVVGKWDAGNLYISLNGGAFVSASSTGVSVLGGTVQVGWSANNHALDGDLLWYAAGTGTLTNTDASNINALGNTDPYTTNFSQASYPSMVWHANTSNYQTPTSLALQVQNATGSNLFNISSASTSLTANTSAMFKNSADSTTAFQVQNAAGTSNLLVADTSNSRVGIGAVPATSLLTIGTNTTTAAGGITFGTDTSLYRSGSGVLTTPGALNVGGNVLGAQVFASGAVIANLNAASQVQIGYLQQSALGGPGIRAGIEFGSSGDTNIYRNAAGALRTDSTFQIGGPAGGGGTPSTNSTTSFQVQNASGALVLGVDTTNKRVNVGSQGTSTGQLYVSGSVPTAALGTITTTTHPNALAIQGKYAYVVKDSASSLQIFDVSNPASPVSVGSVATTYTPSSITVQGRYAYVGELSSTNGVVEIIDIGNPSAPVAVGNTGPLVQIIPGGTTYITAQGRYIYVTMPRSNGSTEIEAIDAANSAKPAKVSTVASLGSWEDPSIRVQGRYLYAVILNAAAANTVWVYDISNPGSPTVVYNGGGQSTDGIPSGLAVSGRYAYIAGGSAGGLQVFDISNPAAPSMVGSTAAGTSYTAIVVQGRYAYASNSTNQRIDIYDISNPAAPTSLGNVSTTGTPQDLAVSGRYAYTVSSSNNLQAFNLGGEYAQQLEAGGIETNSLIVSRNSQILGDEVIQGGLSIGSGLQASGNLGISGTSFFQGSSSFASGILGGLSISSLSTPSAPTVAPRGTAGSTSYSYAVTAVSATGGETATSSTGTTATGNATLNATNYNDIGWTGVSGAVSYKVYRTASGGTPATTGFIGSTNSIKFDDTGLAASGGLPTVNTTGNFSVTGNTLFKPATDSATAFQVQNATGTSIFTVDTSGLTITLGPASATPVILVLGNKNTSGDPSCTDGGIYYNSNSTQIRGCVNGAWNNLAGTNIVTTIPTTNLYDGRTVKLRVGSSPYSYVSLTYDATYGKWVSDQETGISGSNSTDISSNLGGTFRATTTGTASTYFPGTYAYPFASFSLQAKQFTNAGLALQILPTGETWCSTTGLTCGLDFGTFQISNGANDESVLQTPFCSTGVGNITTPLGINTGWCAVTAPTKDTLVIMAIVDGPNGGAPTLYWRGALLYRWVSQ